MSRQHQSSHHQHPSDLYQSPSGPPRQVEQPSQFYASTQDTRMSQHAYPAPTYPDGWQQPQTSTHAGGYPPYAEGHTSSIPSHDIPFPEPYVESSPRQRSATGQPAAYAGPNTQPVSQDPLGTHRPKCRFPSCHYYVFFDRRVNELREWCSDDHMRAAINEGTEKPCIECGVWPRRYGFELCSGDICGYLQSPPVPPPQTYPYHPHSPPHPPPASPLHLDPYQEHPAKNTLSAPVNNQEKAADIDRKLRFYGALQAFRQGRYPSNKQIDSALCYVLDHSPVDQDQLSPEGRKLIQDCRKIIETARLIVQEKNGDELFQNFLWNTNSVDVSDPRKDPNEVLSVDKYKVQDDSRQAACHLRTLGNLIVTNSEVRKIFSDFSVMGRDVLFRTASHAAETIHPIRDALGKVDQAAPLYPFKSAVGSKVGPSEMPVAELGILGSNTTIRYHYGAEIEHNDQVQSAGPVADETRERVTTEAKDTVEEMINRDADADTKKSGLNGLSDFIPQEHEDAVHEQGRKVLVEEYLPEDRRDQFIYRIKKAILECQKHHDYQESIRWFLGILKEYGGHSRHIAGHGKEVGSTVLSDDALRTSIAQIRTLLERFANGKSMDTIIDAINQLIDDTKKDEEFRQWFHSVDIYVRKVLLEHGYVLGPLCNSDGREVRESGRRFYDEKYKAHFDHLFNSVGTWFSTMGEDPLNIRFGDDWARLTADLLFDSEGSLKFKSDLWTDVRKVILSSIVDRVGHVPIPCIEYTNDSLDLVVENLTLQGRNLFPNIVSIETHNFMKCSPYNTINDVSHHEFTLTFGHVQADMCDVIFYFRRKSGIPKLTDSGVADVLLGGQGLAATVQLVSVDNDKSSVFKVKSVRVKVDSLRFSIRDSKHDILYKTIRPLVTALVKKQIQKAVAGAITTGIEYVDNQLVAVRDRVKEARTSSDISRTDVLCSTFRGKENGEKPVGMRSAERRSQFKVVAKGNSAILAKHGHPSGRMTKARERTEAAASSESWHSDAFTIA